MCIDGRSVTFIAAGTNQPSSEPYHLRRKNYLNHLQWDEETEYLAVYINGVEVEFDIYPGIVTLINQATVGDEVKLCIEEIEELPA